MATATVIASLSLDLAPVAGNFVRWKLEQDHGISATTESAVQLQVDPDDAITGDDQEVRFAIVEESHSCTADTGTDKITLAAHGYSVRDVVQFGGTAVPSPLVAGTSYYVRDVATNDFKVAADVDGAAINLTTTGTSVTVRRMPASVAVTAPYGFPGVATIVRAPGSTLDFTLCRALMVTLMAQDAANDALAYLRVTAGDPADSYAYANLPLVLDHTGGDDPEWPSALIQCPAGLTFDPAYPLRLEVREGDSNVNARVLIQVLGK